MGDSSTEEPLDTVEIATVYICYATWKERMPYERSNVTIEDFVETPI